VTAARLGDQVQPTPATLPISVRAARALRHPGNWVQLAKFAAVGASGYAVNLAVYAAAIHAGLHFRLAAVASFVVSAGSNYLLNRHWTFRAQRGSFAYQGVRFLAVSAAALAANQVWLTVLVWAGAGKLLAQAVSILLVMPLNFVGNKLWSFRGHSS
jgi:putative flippase GtrA